MKRYVKSADFEYYNANVRGKNVGDCVKRSISLAFEKSYQQVSKDLNSKAKELTEAARYRKRYEYNYTPVFSEVIKEYGGSSEIKVNDQITVEEFADSHDGVYLILCGKTRNYSSHMVCIINHSIYDSWDSRGYLVLSYFTVSETHSANTNIIDSFPDLANQAIEFMRALSEKYEKKYNIGGMFVVRDKYYTDGYSFKVTARYAFTDEEDSQYLPEYDMSIVFVFTPNDTLDAAKEKVTKTVKQKLYDKFWSMRKDVEGRREGHELAKQAGIKTENFSVTPREKRFYNSLPSWFKPFITGVYVNNPGEYSDSYAVYAKPLPGDPRKEDLSFTGYDSYPVKEMIKRYKENYERPDLDYDPYVEYY